MGRRSVRVAAVAMVAIGLSLVLAACGDDDEDTSTAAGQGATTQATQATTPTTVAQTTTTQAAGVVKATANAKFGTILTDSAGKALYTFDRDTSATSTCTANCAVTWPALLLPAGGSAAIPNPPGVTGTLTGSPRPDGNGTQVVWNGKPLYRYSGDPNAGDTNGDGVGGVWHVAKL